VNRTDYIRNIEAVFNDTLEIIKAKSADYATEDDPFKNFRVAETLGFDLSEGILIRMSDKFSRISNLLQHPPNVANESITDTLADLVAYSAILLVYLNSQ